MGYRIQHALIWIALVVLIGVPILIAAQNPYLQYRDATYVIAGFAGIIGLAVLLVQPLLAGNYLPGIPRQRARKLHHWLGAFLVICVAVHVTGLYFTSAPDTIDALLLRSPTPFSVFGVVAMWGVVATAFLVALRRPLRRFARHWHGVHHLLSLLIVIATVIHAVQIDGAMGTISKVILCGAVLLISGLVFVRLRFLTR